MATRRERLIRLALDLGRARREQPELTTQQAAMAAVYAAQWIPNARKESYAEKIVSAVERERKKESRKKKISDQEEKARTQKLGYQFSLF